MLHSRATVLTGIDAAVLAWRLAVGTVSPQMLDAVSAFVAAEKASGCWALTDDYWVLWGENETQALTSLKQRRAATAVNSPTFTAGRGYAFDGATNYLNTGFVPSTHAVSMASTNERLSAYERTNVGTLSYAIGGITNTTQGIRLSPRRSGDVMQAQMNATATPGLVAITDSRGFSTAVRSDASTWAFYKNGTFVENFSPTSPSASLGTAALYIGCFSNAGAATLFRASSLGFLSVGASLSTAQELAQYNAVQAFATAVGAQV